MIRPPADRRASLPAALVLVLLFTAFYGRYLAGQAPSGGDLVNQYIPYQQLIRNAIHQGAAPLWNSFTFLGRPLMADIQIGVLYPPNWLHWFLPLPVSFALVLALHGAWMLTGCWRLGRAWGLHPAATALGAVLFAASPFFMLKMSQGIVLFIYVGAWWPWLALGATRLARRPGFPSLVLLGLALAMSLLAGSPQMTFYGWIATLAIGLCIPVAGAAESNPDDLRTWLRQAALLAGAFVLAMALTAVQTFQTYHFISTSFERGSGAAWEYVTDSSLDPRLLWIQLNPGLLGIGASDRALYWGSMTDFGESCFYAPIWVLCILIPLGFAVAGKKPKAADASEGIDDWLAVLRGRLARLAAGTMLLGPALAMGSHSYVFRLFFEFVPGFDRFRVPLRLAFFFTAGEALLAALAAHRLLTAETLEEKRLRIVAVAGSIAALALAIVPYLFHIDIWRATGSPFLGNAAQLNAIESSFTKTTLGIGGGVAAAAVAIALLIRAEAKRRPLLVCCLALIAGAELTVFAWPFQPSLAWNKLDEAFYPKSEVVKTLLAQHRGGAVLWMDDVIGFLADQDDPEIQTNRLVMQDLPAARGYDPVNARWIGEWFNLLGGAPPETNPGGFMFADAVRLPAWLTLMGVESVVSTLPQTGVPGLKAVRQFDFPPDPEIPGAPPTTVTVWRNENFRGRAFAAPRAPLAGDWRQAMAASAQRASQTTTDTLAALTYDASASSADLVQMRPMLAAWTASIDASYRIETLPSDPNRFRYRVDYPQAALLCLAQSAYDGWTATVDGEPAAFVSDYSGAFVVAAVPQGKHIVEFRFIPSGLRTGRTVSLIAALAIFCGLLLTQRKAQKRAA